MHYDVMKTKGNNTIPLTWVKKNHDFLNCIQMNELRYYVLIQFVEIQPPTIELSHTILKGRHVIVQQIKNQLDHSRTIY